MQTPLDLAVGSKKEEAAAVLRAHGALHSLLFAAHEGMSIERGGGGAQRAVRCTWLVSASRDKPGGVANGAASGR